jgi:DNA-binding MarR family transcriptional regulator
MKPSTYRDMHLLNEVTQSPDVTQRELSRRIGAALGLTNLMLRRLAQKGYIKISGTKRSRIRYLITPQGILEKSRLTYEFVQHSLHLYGRVRVFLREQLSLVAKQGHRRILLCGTGELSEIAFLTIHEMGFELVGVVDEQPTTQRFLGHPVQDLGAMGPDVCDCVIVASRHWNDSMGQRLTALGAQDGGVILLPMPGTTGAASLATAFMTGSVPSIAVPAPVAAGEAATG